MINQATVQRGLPGCTPTPGTLITICQPGSYRLSGNLSVAAGGSGISINASGVTLDLNGFTLSGTGATGVDVSGDEVTISGGVIHGFSNGIFDHGFFRALTIRGVTVEFATYGVLVPVSPLVLVEDSVLHGVSGAKIAVLASGGLVTRCTISMDGSEDGIALYGVIGSENLALAAAENSISAPSPTAGSVTSVGNNVCNGSKC